MQPAISPTRGTNRVAFVDSLRGFALLGVFGANLLIFSGFTYMSESQRAVLPTARMDAVVYIVERVLVENKFIGLFSILFGVSFWLFLSSVNSRGLHGRRLFYRRLGWLFAIGAVHGWFFWAFDVLRFYALWGLLLPLFLRLSHKSMLSLALFFAILGPAIFSGLRSVLDSPGPDPNIDAFALDVFSRGTYREVLWANWIYDWYLTLSVGQIAYQLAVFGRLVFGLCAARYLVLTDLRPHLVLLRGLVITGGIVGLAGNILVNFDYLNASGGGFFVQFLRRLVAELGYLGLSVAYSSGLILLFQLSRWSKYLLLLAPVGRMALTCYLLQSLFGLWLFYGFMPGPRLMGSIGPTWLILVWLIGYAFQVWFASVWLRHFRFGPMEWLWRSLTYWRIQPLRLGS